MGSTSFDGGLYLSVYANALNTTNHRKYDHPKDLYESFFIPKVLSNVYNDVDNIPQIIKDMVVFEYTDWEHPDNDMDRTKTVGKTDN